MQKRVFIIEDDVNNLYSLQAKLSVEGFAVKTETGNSEIEEVINKIKLYKPDYIILDLILPKIDGFDILSAIKSDKDFSNIAVFVFTNLSDMDSKIRSEKLGADYYFIKNEFVIDEFVNKFNNIIKNKEKIKK